MVLECFTPVRFALLQNLTLIFFLSACSTPATDRPVVSIDWQDSIPRGLIIQRSLEPSLPADSLIALLEVHLANDSTEVPLLGEWIATRDAVRFKSLIPLTRSLTYEVRFQGKGIDKIRIPSKGTLGQGPEVVKVYPTADTLPENLLKFYVQFSKPMWQGDPLSYVHLLRNGTDTVKGAFLDLRPALWDREGKWLTLWLDPGRIKRDLKPNQRLGPPLEKGNTYRLILTNTWRDVDGELLSEAYFQDFYAGGRDGTSPLPEQWKLTLPMSRTRDSLQIEFGETLDVVLLYETIQVLDERGANVKGIIHVSSGETCLAFAPRDLWQPGRYEIRVEPRLEDLAGNNLNRLFDQDVTIQQSRAPRDFYSLQFELK